VAVDDRSHLGAGRRAPTLAVSVGGSASATETIDLSSLFGGDLSPSGRPDLQDVKKTSFGKLLHAIPIPTFLVDRTGRVVFANQAWRKITPDYQSLEGQELSSIFPRKVYVQKARSLLEKVLATRKTQVFEAPLLIKSSRVWARMHLRSLRMRSDRSVLVLVEDLTAEKKQMLQDKKYRRVLKQAHADLEKRVQERTRELSKTNEQMRREISDRERAEQRLELAGRVISGAREAIFIADAEGRIVDVNDAFCRITGRAKAHVVGQDLGMFDWGPD
jgi:PAS domain S-box-containing protein